MVEQKTKRRQRQSRRGGMPLSSTRRRQSAATQWAALSIALLGLVWTTRFAASAFTTVPYTSLRQNDLRTSSSSSAFTLPPPYPSTPQTTTTTTSTQLDLKRPSLLGCWSSRIARRRGGGASQQQQPSSSDNSRIVAVAPRTTSSKEDEDEVSNSRRRRARQRIRELARKIVLKPIQTATTIAPMPQAIAEVLKDATLNAVDMAVDDGEWSPSRSRTDCRLYYVSFLLHAYYKPINPFLTDCFLFRYYVYSGFSSKAHTCRP